MERGLTNDSELRERYRTLGVVLFIFNSDGQILTTIENQEYEETQIRPGQFSVVCESAEIGETIPQTVVRGLKEELGLSETEIEDNFFIDLHESFLGEIQFLEHACARVFAIYCNCDIDQLKEREKDNEIEILGWTNPEALVQNGNLREGVRNVLSVCLRHNSFSQFLDGDDQLLQLNLANLGICLKT